MEITALSKNVHVGPRKMRLVVASVKKLSPDEALAKLSFMTKTGARPLIKTLESAIANAVNNGKLSKDSLKIKNITVDEGDLTRRRIDKSHGSRFGRSIQKQKGSHIKVVLEG